MKKEVAIYLFEVVGSPLCVASNDGQKVYERLAAILSEKHSATLSFRNITTLTSAFLNTAIGQLYGKFSEDEIRDSLSVEDIDDEDIKLLKRVVDNAKQYFKDPNKFNQAIRKGMEIGDSDA